MRSEKKSRRAGLERIESWATKIELGRSTVLPQIIELLLEFFSNSIDLLWIWDLLRSH